MPRLNVIIDDELYLKIIKIKSGLQKLEEQNQNPKNINLTITIKHILQNGIKCS